MNDPYEVMGLSHDSDDEAIRRRYLALIKEHSPERDPEQFARIRQAYEQLRDLETRIRMRLFEPGKKDSLDKLIEEIECRTSRRRLPLQTLITVVAKP